MITGTTPNAVLGGLAWHYKKHGDTAELVRKEPINSLKKIYTADTVMIRGEPSQLEAADFVTDFDCAINRPV